MLTQEIKVIQVKPVQLVHRVQLEQAQLVLKDQLVQPVLLDRKAQQAQALLVVQVLQVL
jgi:hypothetical protein